MVEVFPGSAEPLPPLLTALETCKLLRLDVVTNGDGQETPRAPADSIRSLRHLVRTKQLAPRHFGKSQTYARDDLLRLINQEPAIDPST